MGKSKHNKKSDANSDYPRKYWWLVLVIIPITIAVIANWDKFRPLTSSNTKEHKVMTHLYTGSILGTDGHPLPDAEVMIEVPGLLPLVTTTDSKGIYVFSIPLTKEDIARKNLQSMKSGRIKVKLKRYKPYNEHILWNANSPNEFHEIRLIPITEGAVGDVLMMRIDKKGWLDLGRKGMANGRIYEFDLFNLSDRLAVVRKIVLDVLEVSREGPPQREAALAQYNYEVTFDFDRIGEYLVTDAPRKYPKDEIEKFSIRVVSKKPGYRYHFRIKIVWYLPEEQKDRVLLSKLLIARFYDTSISSEFWRD